MVRTMLFGAARATWYLACIGAVVTFGLGYVAYRLLRAAWQPNDNREVRAASFGVLVALVGLGRAMQAGAGKHAPPVAADRETV